MEPRVSEVLGESSRSTRRDHEMSVGVFISGWTPPGTSFALAGTGAAGLMWSAETGKAGMVYAGLKGAFWSARYPRASCRSLYIPNPARSTVLATNGLHANPMRGCGKNFALLAVNRELPICGCVEITPFAN